MLKRNGEAPHAVPSFTGKLTSAELDAYNAAFGTIQAEFDDLRRVKEALKELIADPGRFAKPDARSSDEVIETNDPRDETMRWQVCSRLLKLKHSEALLCERSTGEGKQFAVIDRFQSDSPYARANGPAHVFLTGKDAVSLVHDYATDAQHTLRFMASNIVARAQKVVWERYANQNPANVVRAISERCAAAITYAQNEIQAHAFEQSRQRTQSTGQSV